jgi:hypothetical protein
VLQYLGINCVHVHTQWVPEDSGQHFAGRWSYFVTPSIWVSQVVSAPKLINDW